MQKATGTKKVQTQGKECRVSRGHKEEGSGEIQRKAPMPEWEDATKEEALVKPEGSTYAGARSARERQERAKF